MSSYEDRLRAMQPGESIALAWYAGYDMRLAVKRLNKEQQRMGGTLYYKVYGTCEDARVYLCDWSAKGRGERDEVIEGMVAQLEALEPGGYARIDPGEGYHQWRLAAMKAGLRAGNPSRYRVMGRSIIRWHG